MHEVSDMDLLQQYVRRNCDEAFAALVRRHVSMVYSAALRKTGNTHTAEEITQAVFVILAKKAGVLSEKTVLSGWLYQTTRLTAANFLKTEFRRIRREQEAYMQSLSNETESAVWSQIAPLLEDAMGQLSEKDRNAIVLRFVEGKSFHEMAAALGASENAAKKRVGHALEQLRRYFSRRGVVSTTTLIAGAISANSIQAAPPVLAKSVTIAALTKGMAAGSSTSTLINGTLKVMAWTKAKTLIAGTIVLACIATTTTLVIRQTERLPKSLPVPSATGDFPKSSWAFAGYGDPVSAYMSFLWSHTAGNLDVLWSSLTPEEYERQLQELNSGAKKAGKSLPAYFQSRKELPNLDAFQILGRQVISDDQVVLLVQMRGRKGNSPQGHAKMKKLGNQWKFDGMAENPQ